MSNLALNKTATASSSIAPYLPARAVDGSILPLNRWMASQLPGWIEVDLGSVYWLNRWVVKQPGGSGWQVPNYNMVDFRFQGSLDNVNWFDIDAVTNNRSSTVDRTTVPKQARYARIYVTKGLRINSSFAAIMELEVYDAANAPYLTNLVPSVGALSPVFSQKVYAYTVNVEGGTSSIQFTPTALQTNMVVKVNGSVVASGQTSLAIGLNTGNNTVTVTVASADNSMTTTYTVTVVKAGTAVATLSSLVVLNNRSQNVSITPQFVPETFTYTASVANSVSSVTITPDTAIDSSTILVNGTQVTKTTKSNPINLNVGVNTISVVITASGYSQGTYTVAVTRAA